MAGVGADPAGDRHNGDIFEHRGGMNPARSGTLSRFILKVAAWLPLAFLVWYIAAPVLVAPLTLAMHVITRLGLSDMVSTVEQQGHLIVFVMSLKPALPSTGVAGSGVLLVEVNPLVYSFGLPLLVALFLATSEPHPVRRLLIAYAVLLPFQTWSVAAELLKNVGLTAGQSVAAQTGFGPWQREIIAFAYQFGALILPTVAPAVVWVLMHRRFLERLVGRGLEDPAATIA